MARKIMIQGTMSGAGKSLLCAAICRILKQDGYRVAPFKSQNMALNSYITRDGKEMGRAQAMQAEAAGVEPAVEMNPVLLKPTTDVGSQVIVNGRAVGNMRAVDYFRYKKELLPEILRAYETLDREYDVIVIEGAGSPVELNLKQDDIVNMGLAKRLQAPVLLVGDIDRGGVFAQLIGTVMLLEEDERALVKGLLVNKFRGDRALFQDGVSILEEKSGKKVVGVIPYLVHGLEEEDSLSEKFSNQYPRINRDWYSNQYSGTSRGRYSNQYPETISDRYQKKISCSLSDDKKPVIHIAVIKLPRMSNYTDFDVFEQYEGVEVCYVSDKEELTRRFGKLVCQEQSDLQRWPDMLILPGTKSTMADLMWLRKKRWDQVILQCVQAGIPVFGICGGYQMLGRWIEDRYGVESDGVERDSSNVEREYTSVSDREKIVAGLGLLPITTVFEKEKITRQVRGRFAHIKGIFSELEGLPIEGYEIHMGNSVIEENRDIFINELWAADSIEIQNRMEEGRQSYQEGCYCGNVYGTYVHGIFDHGKIAGTVLSALWERKRSVYGAGMQELRMEKERKPDTEWKNARQLSEIQKRNEAEKQDEEWQYEDRRHYKERQYEQLAAQVREALDMDRLYQIINNS